MNRTRIAGVALGALAATGLLGACGGESHEDYVSEVNDLQIAYVEDVAQLVSKGTPSTPKAIAETAGDLAGLTASVADRIGAVEPPGEVSDLHDRLVEALRGIAEQIDGAGEALASRDPEQASAAATELQEATSAAQEELDGLIDRINAELEE